MVNWAAARLHSARCSHQQDIQGPTYLQLATNSALAICVGPETYMPELDAALAAAGLNHRGWTQHCDV